MPKQMSVDEFLSCIRKKCEGKHYIFRGTPSVHSTQTSHVPTIEGATTEVRDGISSSLYRDLKNSVPFHDECRPGDMESDILDRAGRFYPSGTSRKEIMTDLQHFQYPHGKTNIIDFSRSLDIALFFACDGEHKAHGELILLDLSSLRDEGQGIIRTDPTPCLMEPAKTKYSRERVLFQRSIFVYPSYGYINEEFCKIILEPVPAELKQPILDYLRKMHDIYADTIYNDIFGFIANKKNYETINGLIWKGHSLCNSGKHREAIQKYDEAEKFNPNYALIYNNRAVPKNKLGEHEEAIKDCNMAIEIDLNYASPYINRGIAKLELRKPQIEVMMDFNKGIELNPKEPIFYNNRGTAKMRFGQYYEAIADYDISIELDSNREGVYLNRGKTKCKIVLNYSLVDHVRVSMLESAIVDYSMAIKLKPSFDAFYNRGVAKNHLGLDKDAEEDFKMAAKLRRENA